MQTTEDPVDRYLTGLTPPERGAIEALRRTIHDLVPSVKEAIRVGVPQFRVAETGPW